MIRTLSTTDLFGNPICTGDYVVSPWNNTYGTTIYVVIGEKNGNLLCIDLGSFRTNGDMSHYATHKVVSKNNKVINVHNSVSSRLRQQLKDIMVSIIKEETRSKPAIKALKELV